MNCVCVHAGVEVTLVEVNKILADVDERNTSTQKYTICDAMPSIKN